MAVLFCSAWQPSLCFVGDHISRICPHPQNCFFHTALKHKDGMEHNNRCSVRSQNSSPRLTIERRVRPSTDMRCQAVVFALPKLRLAQKNNSVLFWFLRNMTVGEKNNYVAVGTKSRLSHRRKTPWTNRKHLKQWTTSDHPTQFEPKLTHRTALQLVAKAAALQY